MVDSSGFQLPAPADWPAFERIVRQLFSRVYSCPVAEMVGRNGQHQSGVDIIGRREEGERGYFGIQCKLKDELGNSRDLRIKTLEDEVARAESIDPPLQEFLLATTAPNDVELQKHAHALTQARRSTTRPLEIKVIGWNQLRAMIGEHRDLLDSYLGLEGVAELSQQITAQYIEAGETSTTQFNELKEMMSQLLTVSQSATNISTPPLDLDDPRLTRAIDRIKSKLASNDVRGAIVDLEALQADEWDEAGPLQRFRILSNLGAAYWRLGEYSKAERFFYQASSLQPDNPMGLANLAAAATSGGDFAQGLSAAQRLLEIHPQSTDALLPLIQAQEQMNPPAHPIDLVPIALRDSEEALTAVAQVLRNRSDDSWLDVVGRGVLLYPESEHLLRMQADATLYRMATVDGAHIGAAGMDVPSLQDVEIAAETLNNIWRKAISCDPTCPDLSIAHNLANALRTLERNEEALAVLEEAEHFGPEKGQIAHLHSILLTLADRADEAKQRLRQHLDDPPSRILLCHLSEEDPAEIRRLLSNVVLPPGSREAMWQAVLKVEALAALQTDYDPVPDIKKLIELFPKDLVPLVALAKRATSNEERDNVAQRIVSVADVETPFADLLQAAVWMRQANLPSNVIALLEKRTNRSEDSPALRWLFEAWFAIDDRAELISALESLPTHVAELPRFVYFQQRAACLCGDMPSALDAAERLIKFEPHSLSTRLDWIQTLHRWRLPELIEEWLTNDVEQLEGSIEERANLALLLANFGNYDRALRFAYRLARLEPNNRHALERYIGVMMNPAPSGFLLAVSHIGPDAVFSILEEGGVERTYRVDSELDLPNESIDLRLDSPIVLAADGLKEGDTFEIAAGLSGLPPRQFRITSVLHKYIHLFRWLTDVLPERFEGPQVVYKTTINPEDPNKFQPMVRHLREREQVARAVNSEYLENTLSLRVIASNYGRSVIDTYDGLTEPESAAFLCSEGGGKEFDLEISCLETNRRRGCVVDTVTMELIRRYDLLDTVRAIAGPISISQATLDDFIERADKGMMMVGRFQGNLSQRHGKLIAERVHPAQLNAAIEIRKSALDWLVDVAEVRPAIGPPGLARHIAKTLPSQLEGQFQDDALIAADTGFLLLTDDLGYRRFAGAVGIRRRAGLAALLRFALVRGFIEHRRYIEIIAAFGRARHRFITVNSDDVLGALELDNLTVGANLQGVLQLMGGPRANLVNQWREVSTSIAAIWLREELVPCRLAIATLLADNLLSEAPAARERLLSKLFRNPDNIIATFNEAISTAVAGKGD